ncbi:MAG: hypothetical protein ACYCUV_09565 [Phycisphaerae bacterium]
MSLNWADIDWRGGQIKITSPKTEHHTGGASRLIPMFPELIAPLLDCLAEVVGNKEAVRAWGLAAAPNPAACPTLPQGETLAVCCFSETPYAKLGNKFEHMPVITRYQGKSNNWRTQLHRIARKAEIPMWPKAFHNMRASRQSELEQRFGLQTACRWLGNSLTVAARHYLMPTNLDEDLRRALALQTTGINSGINLAQIPALQPPVPTGTKTQSGDKTIDNQGFLPPHADKCRYMHTNPMGGEGLAHS